MRALAQVARETALDGAGARCSGSRTPREYARGVVDSESASSRDIPSRPYAQSARRHSIGLRRAKRRANDLDSVRSKHFVKSVRKLLVPITNQETDVCGRSPSVHVTCRACCVTHGEFGVGVHPVRYTRRLPSPASSDCRPANPVRFHRNRTDRPSVRRYSELPLS